MRREWLLCSNQISGPPLLETDKKSQELICPLFLFTSALCKTILILELTKTIEYIQPGNKLPKLEENMALKLRLLFPISYLTDKKRQR
jgi:hypothetical protein